MTDNADLLQVVRGTELTAYPLVRDLLTEVEMLRTEVRKWRDAADRLWQAPRPEHVAWWVRQEDSFHAIAKDQLPGTPVDAQPLYLLAAPNGRTETS